MFQKNLGKSRLRKRTFEFEDLQIIVDLQGVPVLD